MVNFKRLAITDFKVEIPRLAKKKVLAAALEESGALWLHLHSAVWDVMRYWAAINRPSWAFKACAYVAGPLLKGYSAAALRCEALCCMGGVAV
jgi:hypothetical protein